MRMWPVTTMKEAIPRRPCEVEVLGLFIYLYICTPGNIFCG